MKKKNLLLIGLFALIVSFNFSGCKVERMDELTPVGTIDDGGGGGIGTPPPVVSQEVINLTNYFAATAGVNASAIVYNSSNDMFSLNVTDTISHANLLKFYNFSNPVQ